MRLYTLFETVFYVLLGLFVYFFSIQRSSAEVVYPRNLWYYNAKAYAHSSRDRTVSVYPVFPLRSYYFRNTVFFYDHTGDPLHQLRVDSQNLISVSQRNYITYQKFGDSVSLYSDKGIRQWTLDTVAYPFLSQSGNRFILLSTDNTAFSLYDHNRNQLYRCDFAGTMITDFTFCEFNDNLVLGNSSGDLLLVDYLGKELFRRSVKESRYNIIKTVDISERGQYVGVVAGLSPEYVMVFNERGKRIWKQETGANRHRRVSIFCDPWNGLFFEQGERSIISRSLRDGDVKYEIDLSQYPFSRIRYMTCHSIPDRVLLLINTDDKNYSFLITPDGRVVFFQEFEDEFLLAGALDESGSAILIQSSEFIYCYRMDTAREDV